MEASFILSFSLRKTAVLSHADFSCTPAASVNNIMHAVKSWARCLKNTHQLLILLKNTYASSMTKTYRTVALHKLHFRHCSPIHIKDLMDDQASYLQLYRNTFFKKFIKKRNSMKSPASIKSVRIIEEVQKDF
jgi:hypothetical protein